MKNESNPSGKNKENSSDGNEMDLDSMDHLLTPGVLKAKAEGRMKEFYEGIRSGFCIDARKLYNFLYPGEDNFDSWIKENITNNPNASEGKDYLSNAKLN